ncbi:MAG: NUDIX domain-containing protein [Lachnospiraceae bacterium]|nr:NUDIX domain-containing protein [Lachnospiraceae bacterium]
MEKNTTLCYLERDGKYLMLHRISKKNDINRDKWIGVGGHFLEDESPDDCLLREVKEETGYILRSWKYRGIVTFISGTGITEYMSLFTSDDFEGESIDCDEGKLEWVEKEKIWELELWPGDKIFFMLLEEDGPFFSLKLVYDSQGNLVEAVKDGKPMELFDLLHEDGTRSGQRQERGVVHREGLLHETVHMWIVRPRKDEGFDVLLQKRSRNKDSYPGCLDISSAGHMNAGDLPLQAAVREMREELGLTVQEDELEFVQPFYLTFDECFHGKPFHDREFANLFVLRKNFDLQDLKLQEEEVETVVWMDLDTCISSVLAGEKSEAFPHCLRPDELQIIRQYLAETRREEHDRPSHTTGI